MNKYILKFERVSLLKNYAALFFGIAFPIMIASLILTGALKDVPQEILPDVQKSVVLSLSIISPLSTFLIGLASIFAKDLEEGVYDRLELFSINHLTMAIYKFIVYYVFWFICNALYFAVMINAFDLDIPLISLVKHTIFVTILGIGMFFLSYGLCLFTKKYSVAFGITMVLYFGIMILGGMMGIRVEDLPGKVKTFAEILPTSHFSSQAYLEEVSRGGGLNYSFLQSLVVLLLISLIFFAISVYKNKRKNP